MPRSETTAGRRTAVHYPWEEESNASRLERRIADEVLRSLDLVAESDTPTRTARITDLTQAIADAKLLVKQAPRSRVVGSLRKLLRHEIEHARTHPRAAAAIELFVSLGEAPADLEVDFPAARERADELALRLGLRRGERRVLLQQSCVLQEGDSAQAEREPHLALAFFGGLLGGHKKSVAMRLAKVERKLLHARVRRVDVFLWYHLFDRARRDGDTTKVLALFAKNRRGEVDLALRELFGDEAACDRMLAAEPEKLFGGLPTYVLDDVDRHGLAVLRRSFARSRPARWIHLGDPVAAVAIAEELDLDANVVGLHPFARSRTRMLGWAEATLPLVLAPHPRLLEAKEERQRERRLQKSHIAWRDEDGLRKGQLERARKDADGATLFTDAGGYLGVVHDDSRGLRLEARALGVGAARFANMTRIERLLEALEPGDRCALFGAGGIPYLRAARWLSFSRRKNGTLKIEEVAWRTRAQALDVSWE